MNITVISVGKIKEKYLIDGIGEFNKRLSKYCKLNFIELNDEKAPENLSAKDLERLISKEGEEILKHIKEDSYVFALAIEGMQLSSEEFSNKLELLGISGKSNITFIIGGSNGLSKEVLKKADYLLSFSKMTFPHQMMKFILTEQIYRAFRIMRSEPYHK